MGEQKFFMSDLYPSMFSGMPDSSDELLPDAEDQAVLGENKAVAEKADVKNPSTARIMISVIFVIILVVLFGIAE